jgi:hypothetical protein
VTHTGEDGSVDRVPDAIGKLEIVIRKATHELDDDDDGTQSELSESDDADDAEVTGGESDNSDLDETYRRHSSTGKAKNKPRPQRKSPIKDAHDIFAHWSEKKPRHTHTAAYAVI